MVRIEFGGIPPSLNKFVGRNNKWEYRDQKTKWSKIVYYRAKQSPDLPQEPYKRANVRIDYYFRNGNRHDPDNYCGKMLLDGLTKAGVITDDDFKHISLELHGHKTEDTARTVITVTPK